jgi:hypothetical protein
MDHARTVLSRIPALQRPCDLDLLLFFAKHPRTLLAVEQLALLLGHQPNDIAQSLHVLLTAGLITRTQNPTRPARMYVFATGSTKGGSLPAVLELASTREGRLALRRALAHPPPGPTDGPAPQIVDDPTAHAGAKSSWIRRKPETTPKSRSEKHRRGQ